MNDTKKGVVLQNSLIIEIIKLLKQDPTKKSNSTALRNTLSQLKENNPHLYEQGINTIKRYYYATSFPYFSPDQKISFTNN
jgi:hypothetical protein